MLPTSARHTAEGQGSKCRVLDPSGFFFFQFGLISTDSLEEVQWPWVRVGGQGPCPLLLPLTSVPVQEVQRQAAPCPAFGGDQRILAVAEARSGPQRWRPKSSAVQPPPHFSLRWCSRLVNIRSWVPELGE